MKNIISKAISKYLGRFFDSVESAETSLSLTDGVCQYDGLMFKSTILYQLNLPFLIESSSIASIRIDTKSNPINIVIENAIFTSKYVDCFEFNPYLSSTIDFSFFDLSDSSVKKTILSFLFNKNKSDDNKGVSLCLKKCHFLFKIPKSQNSDGFVGLLFDSLEYNENQTVKLVNLSIYVNPKIPNNEKETIKSEDWKEYFSQDNIHNDMIIKDYNFEGKLNDIKFEDKTELSLSFDQFNFLRLFGRKITNKKSGCPLFTTKENCYDWWQYGYRCIMDDRNIFDINSALSFLRNRHSSSNLNGNDGNRNEVLMTNEYKRAIYKQPIQENLDLTTDEKNAVKDFYKQNKNLFDFSVVFSNLSIKVKNTKGILDLGKIKISSNSSDKGIIKIECFEKVFFSSDFLPIVINSLFKKHHFSTSNSDFSEDETSYKYQIIAPLIQIGFFEKEGKINQFFNLNLNSFQYLSGNCFSIKSIENDSHSLKINDISAKYSAEQKQYDFIIEDMDIKTLSLIDTNYKNKLFYKAEFSKLYKIMKQISSNSNFSAKIPKIKVTDQIILTEENDLTFSVNYNSSKDYKLIEFNSIQLGKIIQNNNFSFSVNISSSFDGKKACLSFDDLEISLFSSEILILINFFKKLKENVFLFIERIPKFEFFILGNRGISINLESLKNPLLKFSLSSFALSSVNGFTQFSIDRNEGIFFDKKLQKWGSFTSKFDIVVNKQHSSIDIQIYRLLFNVTRPFLNDFLDFLSLSQKRVELPRKTKIENFTSHSLLINDTIDLNISSSVFVDKNNSNDKNINNNENNNESELNDKFRVTLKGVNQSFTIDSKFLQFPTFISKSIVLSKSEDRGITFCSPFVFENRTKQLSLFIYYAEKSENENEKSRYVGEINPTENIGVDEPFVIIKMDKLSCQNKVLNLKELYFNSISNNENLKYNYVSIKNSSNYDELIIISSEFDYEKGAIFFRVYDPIIFSNQIPFDVKICSSVTNQNDLDIGSMNSKPLPSYLFTSNNSINNMNNKFKEFQIKIVLKNETIESEQVKINNSILNIKYEQFKEIPVLFPSKGELCLSLKLIFDPTKNGQIMFQFYSPVLVINNTSLLLSVNDRNSQTVCSMNNSSENSNKPYLFGSKSYFKSLKNISAFIGFNREYAFSDKPIEFTYRTFSSPLLLPSVVVPDCYLPLFYSNQPLATSSFINNLVNGEKNIANDNDNNNNNNSNNLIEKQEDEEIKSSALETTLSIIDFFLYVENNLYIDFFLTPIKYSDENNNKCKQNNLNNNNSNENCYLNDYSGIGPRVVYKSKEKAPILLASSSFWFKFEYDENIIPLCFSPLNENFETVFRVNNDILVHLLITKENNHYNVLFNQADFSTSLINITNLIENETVFINSGGVRPPLCIEPNSTKVFGYDSPFEAKDITIFAFDEYIKVQLDRNFEPVSSSKIFVETVSDYKFEDHNPNLFRYPRTIIISENNKRFYQNGNNYNVKEENQNFFNFFSINISKFEISFIDDNLSELLLFCLFDTSLELSNICNKSLKLISKGIQLQDMNLKTLAPTILSSNPENANFLSLEINYFNKFTVDRLILSIAPITITPEINFVNEFYYFFRGETLYKLINHLPIFFSRIMWNNSNNNNQKNDRCLSIFERMISFNLVEINPLILILNMKQNSMRCIKTPKIINYRKSFSDTVMINGFSIQYESMKPIFFIKNIFLNSLSKVLFDKIYENEKINIFYYIKEKENDNKKSKKKEKDKKKDGNEEPEDINCLSDFNPSMRIRFFEDKNYKEISAAVLDGLSQTEEILKMASDKMRYVSEDKFDRSSSLIGDQSINTSNASSSSSTTSTASKNSKNKSSFQTVGDGFKSAAKSLGTGFTGIFRKPIEGAKREGAKGAIKGIGQGLLGVLTCTVSSVIEVGGGVAGGIRKAIAKDNSNSYQIRLPSIFLLRDINNDDLSNNNDDGSGDYTSCELAQHEINQVFPKEIEEKLQFFASLEKNSKVFDYIGITENFAFLFNYKISIVEKFELKDLGKCEKVNKNLVLEIWLKKESIRVPKVQKVTPFSIKRYELPFIHENNVDIVINFIAPKLHVLNLLKSKQ